jgi:hypothetical protein
MKQSFLAHGFFLTEHVVYEKLAQELITSFENKTPQRWSIVCERKEDLLSIRTQLFSLLKQIYKNKFPDSNLSAWAGISLYTPDSLVRNFALTFSHNTVKQIGSQAHQLFSKPFLDIVEQERLTRLLLLKLGYSGSDVAPLAKQILTLADTTLPADESFLSILIEVQNLGDSFKQVTDIPDVSLRTICVAYQLIRQINTNYCRLQSFVQEYWQTDFLTHLRASTEQAMPFENFLLPKRFLAEPLLWVAAPEYTRSNHNTESMQNYRPGNFQAHWIDTLRDVLFEARDVYQSQTKNTVKTQSWWARTLIDAQLAAPLNPRAEIHILNSQAALEHNFDELIETAGDSRQFLLGDVDSKIWNIGRTDGSGTHALTPANFAQFMKERALSDENLEQDALDSVSSETSLWENHPLRRIETLHNEFINDWKRIEKFSSLILKALNQYELSPSLRKHGIDFNLLLHRFFDSEHFSVGNLGAIGQLPPALSLLPGITPLKEIVIFGVPHSATQPSFHLRILNAVFFHLRSRQIPLDPIASEVAYRGYWQSIFARPEKVTFNLRSFSEIQKFPDYSQGWCFKPISWSQPNTRKSNQSQFESWLGHSRQVEDPNWIQLLNNTQPNANTTLAVTAFENYVECPLKFYWLHLHKTESINLSAFRPNQLQLGHKAHAMAERFLQSLRHIILLSEKNQEDRGIEQWTVFTEHLSKSFILTDSFLTVEGNDWQRSLLKTLETLQLNQAQFEHAKAMAEQLAELIFNEQPSQGTHADLPPDIARLQQQLTRESLRRAFRKLVQTEAKIGEHSQNMSESSKASIRKAAFLEQPVVYQLTENLRLSGRIDRVDSSPDGDEIIDYKTSKVPRNDPALVLTPKNLNTTNRLSVQGAIYSLAWAHIQKANDEGEARGVKAFSLFRLKTLNLERNPILSYQFENPLKPDSDLFVMIRSEYESYANALSSGLFPAQPVIKDVCKSCALLTFCPTGRNQSGAHE